MLQIDGSYLSGGGQILRTALALSTLTNKPFSITNIRQGRPKPGLKPQHLTCIKALQQFTNCSCVGDEIGSTKLDFIPGKLLAKNLTIDIGTAGSITLLLQSILLPLMFSDKKIKLTLKGGTDVQWSPPIDYYANVLIPIISKFTNKLELKIFKRGYYPKGGGEIELKLEPKYKLSDFSTFNKFHEYLSQQNQHIDLTSQHNIIRINGIVNATKSLMKAKVAERIKQSAELELKQLNMSEIAMCTLRVSAHSKQAISEHAQELRSRSALQYGVLDIPVNIRLEYCDSLSDGCGILLFATFSKDKNEINLADPIILGADVLGEKNKKSEQVGKEVAHKLMKEISSKAAVDRNMADNILPYLALFGGRIKTSELTNHTLTNIYTIEQFLGKVFAVDEKEKVIRNIPHP